MRVEKETPDVSPGSMSFVVSFETVSIICKTQCLRQMTLWLVRLKRSIIKNTLSMLGRFYTLLFNQIPRHYYRQHQHNSVFDQGHFSERDIQGRSQTGTLKFTVFLKLNADAD